MNIDVFRMTYVVGLVAAMAVRVYYLRGRRGTARQRRPDVWGVRAMMSLWGVSQVLAVGWVFGHWLAWADYSLPTWANGLGAAVFAGSVVLIWRAHADLGANFSPLLEIRQEHTLIVQGVYARIRHPMYAAHLLWGVGQALLIENWLAGPTGLATFAILYWLRVDREEAMMLDRFGDDYRGYMRQTGRILPRFRQCDTPQQRRRSGRL